VLGDKTYDGGYLRGELDERLPSHSQSLQQDTTFRFEHTSLLDPLAHQKCLQQVEGL
jgi:hypothetical protein